ncbi:Transcriptional regulator DauR [Vibrio stylophorae]|uniref:Transcriptional regulator DauR n=1 Tax=Vibrio stylophorae TaxID=659351 RepID=A0ABN8DUE5_9VIBR|nr:PAS domain-containing protein [Vibrio stylophorae]CAH0534407.1 Transcriptional regulator DauR [Vibrio stylophorae]
MDSVFQPYEVMVDFLADFLGENAEVVVHDFTDLHQSIRKIRNGHVTGRKVGDPITDLVVKTLGDKENANTLYRCNYRAITKNQNILKCATYFIRNSEKNIIGAMCINMLVDDYVRVKQVLDSFLCGVLPQSDIQLDEVDENLGQTVPELVDSRITSVIQSAGIPVETMAQNDKVDIISRLNAEGVFLLKGSVHRVANELDLSEPTVYKYLQKLK